MSDLTKQLCPRIRTTEASCIPLRLTAFVTGILLSIMPLLLTGCGGGGGGETGSTQSAASAGVTASLAWHPVQDPSIIGYFVHYGRQSPAHRGSCAYEHSMHVISPEATLTHLEPDTRYYFTVSAYNGLESACSNEVSTVTPPPSV